MAFRSYRFTIPIAFILATLVPTYAQEGARVAPPVVSSKVEKSKNQTTPDTSQVNLVVHRLSGLKMLNFLRRSGLRVAPLGNEILMADAVQTSITAGLSLGDGSIVARLPRAELESPELPTSTLSEHEVASNPIAQPSSLFVLQRDGKERVLRFMGLDGGTGLSLLVTDGPPVISVTRDGKEETLALGQHVHIISPARANQVEGFPSNEIFVDVKGIEGNITKILRAPLGAVLRLTMTAEKLSPVVIGGVVVNDKGETIGLVESSNGKEAQLIPINNVRRAVERIRQRLVKKPQPWLGARGIPVAAVSLDQLESAGWKRGDALNLMARQTGVVLTSVPSETPAWFARLRVGDVVTRVNGLDIKSADDFSGVLTFLGANKPVLFSVLKPNRMTPRIVSVELIESMNPILSMEAAEDRASRRTTSDPFVARGIEALSMTSDVATRLNARGGLFVVYVHQSSAASRAGMQTGDVIEAVNNEMLSESKLPGSFPNTITLDVVREGKKIQLTIENDPVMPPPQNK